MLKLLALLLLAAVPGPAFAAPPPVPGADTSRPPPVPSVPAARQATIPAQGVPQTHRPFPDGTTGITAPTAGNSNTIQQGVVRGSEVAGQPNIFPPIGTFVPAVQSGITRTADNCPT